MTHPDEQTTLAAIGTYRRRGAYQPLADWYAALPQELLARPAVALELAAARWRQGYIHEALRLLSTMDRASATIGQLAVAALETAGLEIYRDFSVRAAVEIGRTTLSQLDRVAVSSA